MKDLYVECNDMGLSEKEFKQTFCDRCKNRECFRADWAFSSWDKRIRTQEDRMLVNPNIVKKEESSRWEGISDLETLEYTGVVEFWGSESKNPVETPPPTQTISEEKKVILEIKSETPQEAQPTNIKSFNVPAQSIIVGGNVERKPVSDPWAVASKNEVKVGGIFKMGDN